MKVALLPDYLVSACGCWESNSKRLTRGVLRPPRMAEGRAMQGAIAEMNGRVERFFGTLKERLNHWEVDSLSQLNGALGQFKLWYNHVRPHQHLNGRTPAEVWQGIDVYTRQPKQEYWFEAWDGLLTGYFLRL